MICRTISQTIDHGWRLRIETDVAAAGPLLVRNIELADVPVEGGPRFPRPPRSESANWAGQPHGALCDGTSADINLVYRRILENRAQPSEVLIFGTYLTTVLLGPNLNVLENFPGPIDLRLDFDDPDLERLPWEMMYGPPDTAGAGPNTPLSARANRRFAINREIPLAPGENRSSPNFETPLRVLFVAGTKIDPVLRPGAEFIGLLQHLRIPIDPTFQGDFVGANISLRFLPDGDVDQLKSECASFRPAVLHFICHGERDPAGGPGRIVLRIRPPGGKEGETKEHELTADDLADLLIEDGAAIPPVIVMNACYTGSGVDEPLAFDDIHLPFAAQMVRRGAAIAVGMSGEVADPACQMFTLRFYQALLTETPVIQAASQARRAVLTAWPSYQGSVEWTRPTLFLARGLDGAFRFQAGAVFNLVISAERFRKAASPRMMCDRYDMLVAYDRLLRVANKLGSSRLMVAVTVDDTTKGLGKTRVLQEFAARAVLDGFLPCVLSSEGDMPRSFLDFALALSDAINSTRENFGVQALNLTAARQSALRALPAADPDKAGQVIWNLRTKLPSMSPVTPAEVLAAIREDCALLVADVRAVTGLKHRAMILIDELHRYDGAYQEILKNINFAGFGTLEEPIPLILNYVTSTAEGNDIQKELRLLPPERRPELRRFDSKVERELVYRQLLLSEWRKSPKETPAAKATVSGFFDKLHEQTKGLPILFGSERVGGFIDAWVWVEDRAPTRAIVDADYEAALRAFGA